MANEKRYSTIVNSISNSSDGLPSRHTVALQQKSGNRYLTSKGMPIAAARPRKALLVDQFVVILMFLLAVMAKTAGIITFRFGLDVAFLLAELIGLTAFWWFYSRKRRRLMDRLFASDYGLCLRCAYDLTGLEPSHKCPECGAFYELTEVKTIWSQWVQRTTSAG